MDRRQLIVVVIIPVVALAWCVAFPRPEDQPLAWADGAHEFESRTLEYDMTTRFPQSQLPSADDDAKVVFFPPRDILATCYQRMLRIDATVASPDYLGEKTAHAIAEAVAGKLLSGRELAAAGRLGEKTYMDYLRKGGASDQHMMFYALLEDKRVAAITLAVGRCACRAGTNATSPRCWSSPIGSWVADHAHKVEAWTAPPESPWISRTPTPVGAAAAIDRLHDCLVNYWAVPEFSYFSHDAVRPNHLRVLELSGAIVLECGRQIQSGMAPSMAPSIVVQVNVDWLERKWALLLVKRFTFAAHA